MSRFKKFTTPEFDHGQDNRLLYLAIAAMLLLGIVSRLVPHWPNFTAIGALALWSSRWNLPRVVRLPLALLALIVSDFFLGFHDTLIWVYSGFFLVALTAELLPLGKTAWGTVFSSVTGSLVFFVVTNFGVWMAGSLYSKTGAGLVECFVMALPFLHYQVLGDLLFVSFFAFLFSAFNSLRISKTLPVKED